MPPDKFAVLRERIKDASQKAFTTVQAQAQGKTFYVFSLFSDDDGMTVAPSANTQEDRSSDPYHRWGCEEWKYCGEASEFFAGLPIDGGDEVFRGKLFATMILALHDLDTEGFFGTGKAREAVTLLCSISDSMDAAWLEIESARLLNPPTVYEAYLNDVNKIDGFVEHAKESLDDPESVYRHFNSLLKRAGLSVSPIEIAEKPNHGAILTGHESSPNCADITTDGKILATGSEDGSVRLWDLVALKERVSLIHTKQVRAVAFSPDGKTLASGSGKFVQLWDTETARELRKFQACTAWINSLAFTPDGMTLVTAGADDEGEPLKTWDIASGSRLNKMEKTENTVMCVAVSPDGKTLATAESPEIKLWDITSGKVTKVFQTTDVHGTHRVVFAADGKSLASGGFASDVRLWDVDTGREKASLKTGANNPERMVAISRDGRYLVAACFDGVIKLWSLADGKHLVSWKADSMVVSFVIFTPDAKTLISNGILPPVVKLWDVSKWTQPLHS